MKRLRERLRRWLVGLELGHLSNQIMLLRLELRTHKDECSDTNYDRWREIHTVEQQVKRLALKMAMDDVVKARPEEN